MKKRILSIITCLALSLLPAAALAAPPSTIHVGGVELTAATPYVLNGAGGPIAALPQGTTTGYAHYDAASGVLTLNGFSYSGGGYTYDSSTSAAIYRNGDLTVELAGGTSSLQNTFDAPDTGEYGSGIVTTGKLTVQGDGALEIGGEANGQSAGCYFGFFSEDGIDIKGGKVTICSTFKSIFTDSGSVTISGGELTIHSGDSGIDAPSGDISIEGADTKVAVGRTGSSSAAINAGSNGNITVKSGTLTLNGHDGLRAQNTVEISGGHVTITARNTGISGGNGVTIGGENTEVGITMTNDSLSYGIHTHEADVTINGGEVSISGGTHGIYIGCTDYANASAVPSDFTPGYVNLNGGTIKIENAASHAIAVDCRQRVLEAGKENGTVKLGSGMKIVNPVDGEIRDTTDPSNIGAGGDWYNTIFDGSGAAAKSIEIRESVYTITFVTGDGGTVINPITGVAGTAVTAPADPARPGYTFAGWDQAIPATIPHYDMTVTARWTAIVSPPAGDVEPLYRVTVEESDNGEVKSNRKSAYGGATITLTVTPEEGYALSALTVAGRRGNEIEVTHKGGGSYTFRMPYSDVTVTSAFEYDRWNLGYRDCPRDRTCPIWPCTDADTHAWYHDGVHFCIENSLMTGYGSNLFKPDNPTSRAMITVMLWRLNGSPVVNYPLDFEDVPAGAWYAEAVRWAKSEGVAEGYGNGFFGPNDDVTREQMATILWRYAQYKGHDVSVGEDANILSYEDALTVGEYAIPAMQWACGSGMIVGRETEGGMILDPKGSTTRAQTATMMMRFCAEIVK